MLEVAGRRDVAWLAYLRMAAATAQVMRDTGFFNGRTSRKLDLEKWESWIPEIIT